MKSQHSFDGIRFVIGLGIALTVIFAGLLMITAAVMGGKINEEKACVFVPLAVFLGCASGAVPALGTAVKQRIIHIVSLSLGIFLLCLLAGMLFWQGSGSGIWRNLLACISGGGTVFALSFAAGKKKRHRYR